MNHCLWYHPVPSLFSFFFLLFFSINLQTHTTLLLNGKSFHKTQITRKSIGKIDNQMSSGIELELVAIHWPDYYTPFFIPRSMWTRFWAQNAIPHQTSTRMTHLKVCEIIISCWNCILHFIVFIATQMEAMVRLWKGGTTFEQLGGTKMAVWQPFIPTWTTKSGEPFPGNLKVWMSKRVHFRLLFLKLTKTNICYKGECWHWFNE